MPASRVSLAPFSPSLTDGDRVPPSALLTPDGRPGVRVRYWNPIEPVADRLDPADAAAIVAAIRYPDAPTVDRIESDVGDHNLTLPQVATHHRTEWTGFLVPPESGTYRVGLSGPGGMLEFDGKPASDRRRARWNDLPSFTTVDLVKGRRYPFRIVSPSGADLVWKRVSKDAQAELAHAAASADVLVAVVGLTSDLEAEETSITVPGFEGGDKTTLDLPGDQLALLEQARATGKPLVVVAMNGSPINLAWAKDNAAAILEAWYPGQAGGLAVAEMLTGRANPAGRLPLTFYRSTADLPPFGDYAMEGRTYRYFAGTPVYPFGYGLSYTRFAYGPLTVTPDAAGAEAGVAVTADVANVGDRAGDEVVQLYLDFPDLPGAPRIALRGFQRVPLRPGEHRLVTFRLSPRDLSAVTQDGVREVMPGTYRVTVGSGQPGTSVPGSSEQFSVARSLALPL
jgi:beta-glucosidase